MARTITVELTQAEARVLNDAAADLSNQIEQGDLEGIYSGQKLAAQLSALYRARNKLFDAGLEVG
jgi:hypothetical protein